MIVYAAGPITGLSFKEVSGWRENLARDLSVSGVTVLSPLRDKTRMLVDELLIADSYVEDALSSQRGIYGRDRLDVMRSDLVFANLLGASRVSIGTVMEIAWADSKRTPVVLLMEKTGNPHDHAMLREACYWRTDDFNEAVFLTRSILRP